MMKENWVYCRGDIYCANLDPVVGSEQGGIRPVIVIQNDTGNKHAPTLIVATVTTRIHKKANMPTHFVIYDLSLIHILRSKLRIAQMAAQKDSSFEINVQALEKAQPKDLDASEIDVRLGAT